MRASAILVSAALLCISASAVHGKPTQYATTTSADPQIDLIIVGPGSQFYTIFGHLAVLVRSQPDTPIENGELFNFGVTNFKDSGYLWAFITGTAIFWGNVKPFSRQLKKWNREDRTVTRYPLLLSPPAKRELYKRFKRLTEPEHRMFRYDTFRENCATRVRDALDDVTKGQLSRAWKSKATSETFRDRARYGYSHYPAFLFLLDWGAGRVMDSPRTAWQRAGEPAYFESAIPGLRMADGTPLFGPGIVDAERRGPAAVGGPTVWVTLFSCILGCLLFVLAWRWRAGAGRLTGVVIGCWGLFCGTFGTVLLALHSISLWPETRENWLIAGAFPLDLLVMIPAWLWLRGGARVPAWVLGYVRFRFCLFAAALVAEWLVDTGYGPLGPRMVLLGGWFLINRILDQAAADAGKKSHFE